MKKKKAGSKTYTVRDQPSTVLRETALDAEPTSLRVQDLCATYGMPRQALPRLSGFSQRAIDGWAAGKPPSGPAVKTLTELDRLFAALAKLVAAESIGPWLNRPNKAFEGSTPLQVIERGESDRLWRMIYRLEAGEPA